MSSPSISTDSDRTASQPETELRRSVFICGFIPKRWHNRNLCISDNGCNRQCNAFSSLQVIVQDLLPHYFVACNGESWNESSEVTRSLLSNSDIVIFFVNEFTLANSNCLLTLQYAWHLMIPIIMLRPPRTKLVICKRGEYRDDIIIVGNGSIVRSPLTRWALLEDSTVNDIDYYLLQDVLYEGYKISTIYDRLEHKKSMIKIRNRIENTLRPEMNDISETETRLFTRERGTFYISSNSAHSDSNASLIVRIDNKSGRQSAANDKDGNERMSNSSKRRDKLALNRLNISRSTGNLSMTSLTNARGREREREEERSRDKKDRKSRDTTAGRGNDRYRKAMAPLEQTKDKNVIIVNDTSKLLRTRRFNVNEIAQQRNSNVEPESMKKAESIDLERGMSMNSLDDPDNFQQTQYLVFPLKDNTKKPLLFKFPQDISEELLKDNSVWGSDTSLEQEAEIADQIKGDFSMDDADESPIQTPPPSYIGDI